MTDSSSNTAPLTTKPIGISPDVYTPASNSRGIVGGPPGDGADGTLTDGTFSATSETLPSSGLSAGLLTYAAAEPNVAPFNDSPYDTVTEDCITICPSPGPVGNGGNGVAPDPEAAIGLGTNTLSGPAVSVTTTSLPGGTVGSAYSATLAATDSSSPAQTATSISLSITVSAASAGPMVRKVTPNSGPMFGFTLLRIDGAKFIPAGTHCFFWNRSHGVSVKFGTHAVLVLYATATSVWVLSPAGTGTVDVTVTVKGHASPTSPADHFTYLVVRHGHGFAFGFGHGHLHR